MHSHVPDLGTLRRASAVLTHTPVAEAVPPPRPQLISRVVLPGAILLGFVAVLAYAARDALAPSLEVRLEPVVALPQASESASATNLASTSFQSAGWVEPDPFPVAASALVDGVVSEVLVLEGEPVEAGQVVARLVADDARLARDRAAAMVASKEAQVAGALAAHQAAESNWEHPIELDRMRASSEAMAAEAAAELAALASMIAVGVATVAQLEDQLAREEQVAVQRVVPEAQVVNTRLRLQAARAELESTRAQEAVLIARRTRADIDAAAAIQARELRIEDRRDVAEKAAELAFAQAELDLARTELAEAELALERTAIRTPSAGVVMRRLVGVGSKIMAAMDDPDSTHAVHLYDPARLQVSVDVPLADASRLFVDQEARIVVDVLPDRTFHGKVSRIVNEADLQKNTLQVKVAILDPIPTLKPEMLARVELIVPASVATAPGAAPAASTAPAVLVARRALATDPAGATLAWVVDKATQRVEPRPVVVLGAYDDQWSIARGVSIGDLVVVDPPATITPGTLVRDARPARSSAEGGDDHGAH